MSTPTGVRAGAAGRLSASRSTSADGTAGSQRPQLQLVSARSQAGHSSSGIAAGRSAGQRQRRISGQQRAPLRLTRRGRIAAAVLAVAIATIAITVIGMALAGGAQAANHGRAGAGYQGMHQIVVQPGETLWSIATMTEPAADPRLVIAQIMTANSLTSTVIEAGELLWVPQ